LGANVGSCLSRVSVHQIGNGAVMRRLTLTATRGVE
jgi:hypothetical protein